MGSKSEKITVKLARSFVINYYLGKSCAIKSDVIDKKVFEPILAETRGIDERYKKCMIENDILNDNELVKAGEEYSKLHRAQYDAVMSSNLIAHRKSYRNKAFVESVICGWSFVSGLLQNHTDRLKNHYLLLSTTKKIPDPLNAKEMSEYRYSGEKTYRGLGTRSSIKDRQRVVQLFLAKSRNKSVCFERKFIDAAVNQCEGNIRAEKGYITPEF